MSLELAKLLHRVRRSAGATEATRQVAARVLAQLAARYGPLPALWAVAQGLAVERGDVDIEWHSPSNQGCWRVTLEPGEAAVLASLLRDEEPSAALANLAAALR